MNVRKSFNREGCANKNNGGVDLNRNYDEHFAYDTIGSSSNPCAEEFRGTSAFSEPETRAIKDFVLERKNLLVSLNFHS